jgi:non-ribosomal peptide synthase protein (TIGR01720 family)
VTIAWPAERRRAARAAVRGVPICGTPVPLSPLQREFLVTPAGQARRAPTMARVLEARRPIEPDVLERAARALPAHHPALRLRAGLHAAGGPTAVVAPELAPAVRTVDLDGEDEVAALLDAERRAADCRYGPGLRVAGLRLPDRELVALVADHLVLDESSWWVLERDLEAAIADPAGFELGRGWTEDPAYLRWLARLAEHPATPAGLAGAAYWRDWPARPLPPTPVDRLGGPRTEAEAAREEIALGREETAALRADLPAAVLAAVHASWRDWTGERALPIWLVHHGRRGPLADPGTAGMVGCAAHRYPVLIDMAEADSAAAAREVRRQLDLVPNEGVDHGILRHRTPPAVTEAAPGLICNFVGALRRELSGPVFARALPELGGIRNEPGTAREPAFEVSACVDEGALRMRWTYCRTAHEPRTARRLAGSARRALLALARELAR